MPREEDSASGPPAEGMTDAELRKSEARFRLALAHSGVIVFEHDRALRYTWIYPTQFYEVSKVIGRTDAELFPAPDAQRLMDLKRAVLLTGSGSKDEVSVTRDGRRHEFMLTVEPLRGPDGEVVGLIGASTNISASKDSERELARALEFRDQVLGILGHDLRNPLGAIYGWTRSLLSRGSLAEHHPSLRSIERSARRMLEMIGTLLDFADSRFSAKLPVAFAATDLGAVLREVIDELVVVNPSRRLVLEVEGDCRGHWDAARLAQVASNLIGNALKHGASDGAVRVKVRGGSDTAELEVWNAGRAIPDDRLAGLFRPFQRDPANRDASAARGLGLGLYIADQIVRAHAGAITVRSAEGSGTVFSVTLPRVVDEARVPLQKDIAKPA